MSAPLSVARLPPRRRRRLGLGVLVVLFALLLVLFNLVPLAAEWLWFQAVGYERVFTTRLVAEAVLGVGVGGLVFAFLYVNLRIAQRGLVPNPLVVQVSSGADLYDQRVRDEAALGNPQVDVEEREYEAAHPHAEHGLGHEPCREHTLVTHGLEPEPFGGEGDQIEENQQEGEQDDQ